MLGYVGSITQTQLKRLGPGYDLNDEIGQTGVESAFDKYLRGVVGRGEAPRRQPQPAASGASQPTAVPKPGNTVRLTLNVKLQQAAEKALAYGIHLAQANGEWAARGGAIVALDPRDGSILAMASSPTYKPSVYSGRVTTKALASSGPDAEDRAGEELPLVESRDAGDVSAGLGVQAGDRARGDAGAPRLAVRVPAVHRDVPVAERQVAPGVPQLGPERQPADGLADRARVLVRHVLLPTRRRFCSLPKDRGQPLQHWATMFGFGKLTGSDVGPEVPGLVPTIALEDQHFKTAIDKLWKPGDSIHLAIGQGDLLVTPLQMARFYALIANGGKLVTPHLLLDVEDPNGNPVPLPARRRRRSRSASTRRRSRSSGRGCSRARTSRSARRIRCSASSRSRSPARRAPRRRSSRCPATSGSRTSRGGAATGRPTTRRSSSAP